MHDTALQNAKRFFDAYAKPGKPITVVDIGSQDVNGSLRSVCPTADVRYVGVDFVAGRGVDVLLNDPYTLPFESDSVDIVVSSSCFEHSEFFWLLFLEVLRILKPAGLFYLNAPSNGEFHRYPVDCWRFYPDFGKALANWANRNGIESVLLESYISNQVADQWNDAVSVILKDRSCADAYQDRILDHFTAYKNGRIFRDGAMPPLMNPHSTTQDQASVAWRANKWLNRLLGQVKGRIRPLR
jgi:SAM-dependent methyltransferase